MDILLDQTGDLLVTEQGDIRLENSVAQSIEIRLRWFLEEWRWDREEGLPYFEILAKKNPDTAILESRIRSKIFEVPEVTAVREVRVTVDRERRYGTVRFVALTDRETIRKEVRIRA